MLAEAVGEPSGGGEVRRGLDLGRKRQERLRALTEVGEGGATDVETTRGIPRTGLPAVARTDLRGVARTDLRGVARTDLRDVGDAGGRDLAAAGVRDLAAARVRGLAAAGVRDLAAARRQVPQVCRRRMVRLQDRVHASGDRVAEADRGALHEPLEALLAGGIDGRPACHAPHRVVDRRARQHLARQPRPAYADARAEGTEPRPLRRQRGVLGQQRIDAGEVLLQRADHRHRRQVHEGHRGDRRAVAAEQLLARDVEREIGAGARGVRELRRARGGLSGLDLRGGVSRCSRLGPVDPRRAGRV
ncbi:MAG TPA: hypothetical protein VHE35_20485, partial [Kofleriaceae bacterium]|nr:hypothetical protein [Kofleriaceae bacterium]